MLREWLPWVDSAKTPEDTRAFIEDLLEKLAGRRELTAGIRHEGRFAGVLGARLSPLAPTAELGYWLGLELQGQGLMTRAVRVMLRHLFEERGLVQG